MEVELTSKQKRRLKKKAALKELGSNCNAEAEKPSMTAGILTINKAPAALTVTVPKKAKRLRTPRESSDDDLIADVVTSGDQESEMDSDLMAELAALVRECSESNPDVAAEVVPKDNLTTKKDKKSKIAPTGDVGADVDQKESSNSNDRVAPIAILKDSVNQKTKPKILPAKKEVKEENSKKDTAEREYVKSSGKESKGIWNFAVDYNDHFETPSVAYVDILPMFLTLAEQLGKAPSELIIYDPYYCQGEMVQMLAGLGFPKVVNRNRDFYADIAMQGIPDYDILVTNPPYSGEHKQKLLKFLLTSSRKKNNRENKEVDDSRYQGKPFALLLPAYTANKSYWKEFVTELESKIPYNAMLKNEIKGTSSSSSNNSIADSGNSKNKNTKDNNKTVENDRSETNSTYERAVLYLLPPDSYEYRHPDGTGKEIPPFFSSWFIGGFQNNSGISYSSDITVSCSNNTENSKNMKNSGDIDVKTGKKGIKNKDSDTQRGVEEKYDGSATSVAKCSMTDRILKALLTRKSDGPKTQIPRSVRVLTSIDDLVTGGIITDKRPNPRNRKKLTKARGSLYSTSITNSSSVSSTSFPSNSGVKRSASSTVSTDEPKKKRY